MWPLTTCLFFCDFQSPVMLIQPMKTPHCHQQDYLVPCENEKSVFFFPLLVLFCCSAHFFLCRKLSVLHNLISWWILDKKDKVPCSIVTVLAQLSISSRKKMFMKFLINPMRFPTTFLWGKIILTITLRDRSGWLSPTQSHSTSFMAQWGSETWSPSPLSAILH